MISQSFMFNAPHSCQWKNQFWETHWANSALSAAGYALYKFSLLLLLMSAAVKINDFTVTDGISSDVVRHLMAMSSATRGHCRHPTPSSSLYSLSTSGSIPSGSYAVCLTTPTISVCNLHVGSLDDASICVTRQSNVAIGDDASVMLDRNPNDASRDTTRRTTAMTSFVRSPALLPSNPTLLLPSSSEQNPGHLSPVTAHVFQNHASSAWLHPSPELQLLPRAPLPPHDVCHICPLPAEAEAGII